MVLTWRTSSIPHTRGDGPCRVKIKIKMYSPHAWGWTAMKNFVGTYTQVFPTRVGMDHMRVIRRRDSYCIPHTRGDGPFLYIALKVLFLYSPHAWGWTETHEEKPMYRVVFPTRVGMDRRAVTSTKLPVRIPHTRGDGPNTSEIISYAVTYSPHAWGWTVPHAPRRRQSSVFPTRVGMDRREKGQEKKINRIPHTRGDGPVLSDFNGCGYTYSPHAWGWTVNR